MSSRKMTSGEVRLLSMDLSSPPADLGSRWLVALPFRLMLGTANSWSRPLRKE